MKVDLMKGTLVIILFAVMNISQAAEDKVKYSVKITDAAHHLAEITVLFPQTESRTIDFIMPAWRLGKYQILNLANGIRHFKVTDVRGNEVKSHRIDKNSWRVSLDKPTKLAVSYELYANQLSSRTRHIDDTHAYLDGVSSFVYSPEFIGTKLSVELDVPKGWRSRSGMESSGKHRFAAADYHVLASSPIESGIHEYYSFDAAGKDYELVIWGEGNFDGVKIVDDYKKMVIEHGKLWGNYPFERYLFIIHSFPGGGGATEHINSTIIQRDALGFAKKKDYHKFISTSSHEFVHTWNVKSYRPKGIHRYDYTGENYSDLLWISEGSTSYFGDILLVRSGLFSAKEFLTRLADKVQTYQERPGRKVMTAQQASFNTWIADSGDRANNASVSIYSKGTMLSLLMDVELLKATQANHGYAKLHQLLYERYPAPQTGFSASDIQALMKEISGKDYSEFWQQYMESTAKIDFNDLFLSLGLKFSEPDSSSKSSLKVWTGIQFSKLSDKNKILLSPVDTPAWRAGLASDDTLVAINGIKVESGKFDLLMDKFKDNDEVKVTFFRRNRLKETIMEIEARPSEKPKLLYVEKPSELQIRMYEKWLGVSWPEDKNTSSADNNASQVTDE